MCEAESTKAKTKMLSLVLIKTALSHTQQFYGYHVSIKVKKLVDKLHANWGSFLSQNLSV